MKVSKLVVFTSLLVLALHSPVSVKAQTSTQQPIVIYLLDPDNPEVEPDVLPDNPEDLPSTPSLPSTQPDTRSHAQKKLDELILKNANVKQKRILTSVLKDQKDFMELAENFISTPFDPNDDKAYPKFIEIRDQMVKLVFKAPDQRFFYERLYLINAYWIHHQEEVARFTSLDKALRDRWLEAEDKRRTIQNVITYTTAAIGAVGVGYFAYTRAMKYIPVLPTDTTWITISKWAGRTPIILIGAGVGAYAGKMAGFLGSDLLLKAQRDYVDPIDGTEDLQELLDVIDSL